MMKINQPKNRRIEIGELKFHYLEWGSNTSQTILCLHGFLSQAYIWNSFAPTFIHDYRVLALNQRGHGGSDWSSDGAYSIDDHFVDIAQFIEILDLKDLILLGHSMGGRNALFYTACIPDRVKKLILVDSRPGNSDESISALKKLLDGFNFEADDLHTFLQEAQTVYPHLPLKAGFDFVYAAGNRTSSDRTTTPYDPWLIIASHLADYSVEELWPFMESIPCPTLIVRGEHSIFISQEDADRMGRLIPKAKIVVIPQASHIPMIENPSVLNRAVHSFLG